MKPCIINFVTKSQASTPRHLKTAISKASCVTTVASKQRVNSLTKKCFSMKNIIICKTNNSIWSFKNKIC